MEVRGLSDESEDSDQSSLNQNETLVSIMVNLENINDKHLNEDRQVEVD